MFNMMILQKDLMNDYCSWLFNILFKLFRQVDTTNMSDFDSRFCGRVSEILFNVWLLHQVKSGRKLDKSEICELPYNENVNWGYKIKSFLLAKFLHKNTVLVPDTKIVGEVIL